MRLQRLDIFPIVIAIYLDNCVKGKDAITSTTTHKTYVTYVPQSFLKSVWVVQRPLLTM